VRHPNLSRFLPYSAHTEVVGARHEQVVQRFLARDRARISMHANGLLMAVERQYHITATGATVRISGPHGYKAWTMQTTVAITPAGSQSLLSIWTYPHWRVALALIATLIVLGALAVVAGLLSVLLVPLMLFACFLYVFTVAATRIEALAIADLVGRLAHDDIAVQGATLRAEPIIKG
jgi:hypothetical protein